MNSQKKGPCYGFKLQSLDSLTITKSTDKKQHIVHYLASVVEQKYPELKSFYTELTMLDKASQFSLENIMTDVVELERGMELTRNVLSDNMKCKVDFVNCFLRVPLVYLPCRPMPCCQGKHRKISDNCSPNLTVQFILSLRMLAPLFSIQK